MADIWQIYGQNLGLTTNGAGAQQQIQDRLAQEAGRATGGIFQNNPALRAAYNANDPNAFAQAWQQPASGNDYMHQLWQTAGGLGTAGQRQVTQPGPEMAQTNLGLPNMPTGSAMPAPGATPFSTGMPQQPNPYAGGSAAAPGGGLPSNPFLPAMGAAITDQVTTNLQRNILPQIDRSAIGNGTLGSSRQGIAQGIAIGDTNKAIAGSLANMYGNAYGQDLNYSLGAGNLGLANERLNLDAFNANNQWQQAAQNQQLNTLGTLLGWNQQYGVGNATQIQNTPLNYWQQFTNGANQIAGQGASQSTPYYGSPLLGGLAGWNLGTSIFGG